MRAKAAGAAVAACLSVSVAPAAALPLIGANYTHFSAFVGDRCSLNDTGIVDNYDTPGVRDTVRSQLAAMRAAGIASLRLILWHTRDLEWRRWGVVPSAGGRLPEPYRTNLVWYLQDVRAAGFQQLTVSFAPAAIDDPRGRSYDPTTLDESWAFVTDVRPLVKRYGPPSTHIDLMNEGAPSTSWRPETVERTKTFVAEMYSRYVRAYGNGDVVVSANAGAGRIQNLVDALRSTGLPLPRWFDVHIGYTGARALADLQTVDAALAADGLTQPLVIGETAYDDPDVAAAISLFMTLSERRVLEVLEWPATADPACKDISVSPPYRADAYIHGLLDPPRLPRGVG